MIVQWNHQTFQTFGAGVITAASQDPAPFACFPRSWGAREAIGGALPTWGAREAFRLLRRQCQRRQTLSWGAREAKRVY